MTVVSDRVLAPSDLKRLSVRSDAPGAARLAIHVGLLGLAGWLVAVSGPLTVLPAMLALGLVQAALFAPAHETMHRTAFASRRANAVVGWIASCPSLLDARFYNSFHLAHHRHTQVDGLDPELGAAPDPTSLRSYALRISAIPYWRFRLRLIRDCWRGDLTRYPYVGERDRAPVIRSVRATSLVMGGGAVLAAVAFGPAAPLLYWVGPQLLGQPFLRAYLLAEHTGCTRDRNGLTNTRTTLTNAAVRLLMWDMPFHAEHHLYPSIPFHRLADAHRTIGDRLGVVQPGYARWHTRLVRALARG